MLCNEKILDGRIIATYRLKDGSEAVLHFMRPDCRDCISVGLTRLSFHSRYLRFNRPVKALSDKELKYLTDTDQARHLAFGSADFSIPEFPGTGVARYFVLPGDGPVRAELAVTVVDGYHGRGLGAVLAATLVRLASKNGVEILCAYTNPDNDRMNAILAKFAVTFAGSRDGMRYTELDVKRSAEIADSLLDGREVRTDDGHETALGRFLESTKDR